jgi:ribulose-phosphate 3-epimerase
MQKHLIAPSVLAADFNKLGEEMTMINQSEADWLHVDIMDGLFVPNISFGQFIVQFLKKSCQKPLDVHLMIEKPERYLQSFRDAGADIITVHYEACTHLHRTLQEIKATGAKAGIALNPHTPVSVLEDVIDDADLVCLMSVNPGFGGQKFITQTYEKVRKLRKLIADNHATTLIEIDGGVGLPNYKQLLQAGADVLVAGNSVFAADNPVATIAQLKKD